MKPCVQVLRPSEAYTLHVLKLAVGDIGNAYLEVHAWEKVCVCAGPEFGPLEGHYL